MAIGRMPEEEKPSRCKPGPKPTRAFYTVIEFHLSPELHRAIKVFAAERKVRLEDVYRETAEYFLEHRAKEKIGYWGVPKTTHATHVHIRMAGELRARMREAVSEDHQSMANAFETAVRLYLRLHNRPCS
jgi:hypothetical protein